MRPSEDILERITQNTGIKEGVQGVRRIWSSLILSRSTKQTARALRIPVPLLVAVRNELVTHSVLDADQFQAPVCAGSIWANLREDDLERCYREEYRRAVSAVTTARGLHPVPRTEIDQSFVTIQTAVKRAILAALTGNVHGSRVLFIGDSDMMSVACASVADLELAFVIDLDRSALDALSSHTGLRTALDTLRCDVRRLPMRSSPSRVDTVFSDPPYSYHGITTFLGAASPYLAMGGVVFASFNKRVPNETRDLAAWLHKEGLSYDSLLPSFNEYIGAQLLGRRSDMHILMRNFHPVRESELDSRPDAAQMVYSRGSHERVRVYRCPCGAVLLVGNSREAQYSHVEELKSRGCMYCGQKRDFDQGRQLTARIDSR